MPLELTAEELALLRELLDTFYSDLREEIYKTEDTDYKSMLKEREDRLESLLRKVAQAETSGQPTQQ